MTYTVPQSINLSLKKALDEVDKYATNIDVINDNEATFEYSGRKFSIKNTTLYGGYERILCYTQHGKRVFYDKWSLDHYINRLNTIKNDRKNSTKVVTKHLFKEINDYLNSLGYKSHYRIPGGYRLNQNGYAIGWYLNDNTFKVSFETATFHVIREMSISDPNFDHIMIVKTSLNVLTDVIKSLKDKFDSEMKIQMEVLPSGMGSAL